MNENKLDTNNKLNSISINGPRHYSTSLIVSLFFNALYYNHSSVYRRR